MSVETANYREVIERLPTDSTLILRGISWDDYEELLAAVGEAPGLRISYDQGTMQIMTPSSEHESYVRLIERLVDRVSSKLRIKVLSFGSATMKHSRWRSEEHTSELQSHHDLVCRLLLEKKKKKKINTSTIKKKK